MSEQQVPLGPCDEPDLAQHLAGFLASLAQAGYPENTQRDKAHPIAPFFQWIGASGIGLCEVDDVDTCIDAFLACPARRRSNPPLRLAGVHRLLARGRAVGCCRPLPRVPSCVTASFGA